MCCSEDFNSVRPALCVSKHKLFPAIMLLIPESPLHPFNGVHGILFVLCKYCVLSACRQTIFLPVVGLVDADTMKPGDLVGVNKDSYLILDTLPSEYDSRVKAMEVQHAN